MEAPGDGDRRSRRGAPTLFTAETERSRQSPRGKEAGSTLPLSLPLACFQRHSFFFFFFFPLVLRHFFVLSRAVSGWNLFTQTEEPSCGSGSACRDASLSWHCSFWGRLGRPGGLAVSNVVLGAWVAGMLCMDGYQGASEEREGGGLAGNLSPQDGRRHGAGPQSPLFLSCSPQHFRDGGTQARDSVARFLERKHGLLQRTSTC